METIEERAERYANKSTIHKLSDSWYIRKSAYINGATEQREIDTEKSIAWLEKYMESLGYIDEWCRKGEEEFRKMMEE